MGRSGKCPVNCGSLRVMDLIPTARFGSSSCSSSGGFGCIFQDDTKSERRRMR